MISAKTIIVSKTARYFVLGEPSNKIESIWFVLHGFAQLAEDFIKNFESFADNTKLIIAPEALNKFYIKGAEGSIGATWMTKEDRQNEINDYVNYLNELCDEVLKQFAERKVKINVLGFSQGGATAARWTVMGNSQLDRLIIWGSPLPPDIDLHTHRELLNTLDLAIVAGDEDYYLTRELLESEVARLNLNKIDHQVHIFKGKHQIDPESLNKYFGSAT